MNPEFKGRRSQALAALTAALEADDEDAYCEAYDKLVATEQEAGEFDGLDDVADEPAMTKPVVIIPRQVQRREDMSLAGVMHLFLQEDGDVVVEVSGREEYGEREKATVEFCSGGGGGKSPRTVEALKLVMAAMQADIDAGPRARDYERQYLFTLSEADGDYR